MILEKKILLNFVNEFPLFRNYLPVEKGMALHLKIWFLITQGCFVPNLVEIGLVLLEKKMKMWKVYDSDNNNDNG